MVDCSIVLTLHRECQYVNRTLQSLQEACEFASSGGISTELIIVLDKADEFTARTARSFCFYPSTDIRFIEVENGSLGLSRNDGICMARGEFIATADGDDLVSFNIIDSMVRQAASTKEKILFFPQFLIGFGSKYFVCRYYDLKDVFSMSLFSSHPYISRIFGRKEIFQDKKYIDLRLTSGYAYEDWHYNCESVASGVDLRIAKGTSLFYRQRSNSLLSQANAISARHIPPSSLFHPKKFLELADSEHAALLTNLDFRPNIELPSINNLNHPEIKETIIAANAIDPEVYWPLIKNSPVHHSIEWTNYKLSAAYFNICRILGDIEFDDVILSPYVLRGGGDRYFIDIANALISSGVSQRVLILLGEKAEENPWKEKFTPECVVLEIANMFPELDEEPIDLLSLKIIQHFANRSRIHIRQSTFGQRFFERYHSVLPQRRFFYRFCDEVVFIDGTKTIAPWGPRFVSENIDRITRIISDNNYIIETEIKRLGNVYSEKFVCLNNSTFSFFANGTDDLAETPVRTPSRPSVLWASRFSFQKRPELLQLIGENLKKSSSPITLEIFGQPDSSASHDFVESLSNLNFHGPYDKFFDIGNDFICFLYTSHFDGMPYVLLEAASAGIPIVAIDVGGISEFVEDGITGILVNNLEDDRELADRISIELRRLFDNNELRKLLVDGARSRLLEAHSAAIFKTNVSKVFG